jgi:GMP reductase
MQKIVNEEKLDFNDVLIVPQRSTLTSRSDIHVDRTFKFYHSPREWTGIPIICANMSFSSFRMADALSHHKMITCLHKYHTTEEIINYFYSSHNHDYVWISIGYKKADINNLIEFKNRTNIQPNICIDVPNGHMDVFVKYCKKVREHFPESIIMAGNVTNTSSTQELLIYGGVDIIKTGIGGGSACTTRFLTGCGVPQLSCCLENGYVAHGLQNGEKKLGRICSDGGHKTVGDVCKALCAGSDFVMLGGYFAGTEECDGEWEYDKSVNKTVSNIDKYKDNLVALCNQSNLVNSRKTKFTYYGMSTHHAQEMYEDHIKTYRASEGTKIVVDHKGPVECVIQELLGGIRSCCCYIGASSIKHMQKCGQFCRVSSVHSNKNPILGV